jgi:hypothetical protein
MYVLRSCYSTQARFFYDSDTTNNIIWYWCEAGAPAYTAGHHFAPITFSDGRLDGGLSVGEQPSQPRPWRNGSIPMAPPSGVLDGTPIQFQNGQSVEDPGLARTSFGIPLGCATVVDWPGCGSGVWHFTWRIEQPPGTLWGTAAPNLVFDASIVSDTTSGFRGIITGSPEFTLGCPPTLNLSVGTPIGTWVYYGNYSVGPPIGLWFQQGSGAPNPATDFLLISEPGP